MMAFWIMERQDESGKWFEDESFDWFRDRERGRHFLRDAKLRQPMVCRRLVMRVVRVVSV